MAQSPTSQVFMSYSRRDDVVMRRIAMFLRKQGIKVWVDNEKLVPGTPIWEEEIEKAVKDASAVVVVLSPDSKGSEWVRREISLADQYRKRVFPVLVRGNEEASITLRLINRQFVDLRGNENAGLSSLKTALSAYLKELSAQEEKEKQEVAEKAGLEIKEKIETEKVGREAMELASRRKAERKEAFKAMQNVLPKLKILALVLFVLFIGYLLWQGVGALRPLNSSPNPTQAEVSLATAEETVPTQAVIDPAFTPIPSTEIIIPMPTIVGIGSTMLGLDSATLVYVPEGEFTMGGDADDALAECQKFRTDCERNAFIDEEPPHSVNLDSFWIDQTEVTNAMYEKCVAAGKCNPPNNIDFFSNSSYANHPVVYVNWNQANAYCDYAGRRLPTEAEWEKAASWEDENQTKRLYPWGNSIDCSFGNFNDKQNGNFCAGDTTTVKSYESGKSFYGAYDMAGNVWEWVDDWYGEIYYLASPLQNPLGPDSGTLRVLRGGSWFNFFYNVRSTVRHGLTPDHTYDNDHDIGFRCAISIP